ncbi:hypothetical protein BCR39DRAFT_470966 [Naematelia encephala]|uniref:NmrA-like domain-containing protein n=1 Tax=Naematelia encephala TaxID=71784 RepID=A0A1Y2AU65_9TREE|nr:hypothetical protein BCR39DRAFT_470966 [Naematelia encephala]
MTLSFTSFANVAVAGATGRLGPAIVDALVEAGFNVKALTRTPGAKYRPEVEVVVVDYLSPRELVEALQGQNVVIVFGAWRHPGQLNLVDAAIEAGVYRFIPAMFSNDLTNPLVRQLPVHGTKLKTEAYIKAQAALGAITYNLIATGPFADMFLPKNTWINKSDHTVAFFDGNPDSPFTGTTRYTLGEAIISILRTGPTSDNRTYKIQRFRSSPKRMLELVKDSTPGYEWKFKEFDTLEMARLCIDKPPETDPDCKNAYLSRGVHHEGYGGDFPSEDSLELGLEIWSEEEYKERLIDYINGKPLRG